MPRSPKRPTRPTPASTRRDRLIEDSRGDPYRANEKVAERTSCPDCGASFRQGRWTWEPAASGAPQARCPACRRIEDDYPGGFLRIEGEFAARHRDEILALVRNVEERERSGHPLQRVMAIRPEEDAVLVTTTDPHLAHGIATALQRAYRGELEANWADGEALLRASWRR